MFSAWDTYCDRCDRDGVEPTDDGFDLFLDDAREAAEDAKEEAAWDRHLEAQFEDRYDFED